jgi:hypothetical protein
MIGRIGWGGGGVSLGFGDAGRCRAVFGSRTIKTFPP